MTDPVARSLPQPALKMQVLSDYESLSRAAAEMIIGAARSKPDLVLGVASGSTPTRAYELLASKRALFRGMRLLKLDEWGGLAMDDPATCETYLRRLLLDPLTIAHDRYIAWDSNPPDPRAECDRIRSQVLHHGPIDLCVLGLGANGHLAFNEPADALTAEPHVANLSQESLDHRMLATARSRPTFGLTVGIADILQSRQILLLVSGTRKAAQLRRLMEPEITPAFPASFLWLHRRVTILADREAAGR